MAERLPCVGCGPELCYHCDGRTPTTPPPYGTAANPAMDALLAGARPEPEPLMHFDGPHGGGRWTACGRPMVRGGRTGPPPPMATNPRLVTCLACRRGTWWFEKYGEIFKAEALNGPPE